MKKAGFAAFLLAFILSLAWHAPVQWWLPLVDIKGVRLQPKSGALAQGELVWVHGQTHVPLAWKVTPSSLWRGHLGVLIKIFTGGDEVLQGQMDWRVWQPLDISSHWQGNVNIQTMARLLQPMKVLGLEGVLQVENLTVVMHAGDVFPIGVNGDGQIKSLHIMNTPWPALTWTVRMVDADQMRVDMKGHALWGQILAALQVERSGMIHLTSTLQPHAGATVPAGLNSLFEHHSLNWQGRWR